MGIWSSIKSIFKKRTPMTGVVRTTSSGTSGGGGGKSISSTTTSSTTTSSSGGGGSSSNPFASPAGTYYHGGKRYSYGAGQAPSGAIYTGGGGTSGGGGGGGGSSSNPFASPAGTYYHGGKRYSYGAGQAPSGAIYTGGGGTSGGGGGGGGGTTPSPIPSPVPSTGYPVFKPSEASRGTPTEQIVSGTPSSITQKGSVRDWIGRGGAGKGYSKIIKSPEFLRRETRKDFGLIEEEALPKQTTSFVPSPIMEPYGGYPESRATMSFLGALRLSAERLVGRFGSLRSERKDIFEPFDWTVTPKYLKPSGQVEVFGWGGERAFIHTDTTSVGFGEHKGRREVTYGEIVEPSETRAMGETTVERGFIEQKLNTFCGGVQAKIDVGNLTYEEGVGLEKEKRIELRKEFETKVEDIWGGVKDYGIHDPITSPVKGYVETAALFNPLTTAIYLGVQAKEAPLKPIDISKPLPLYMDTETTTQMKVTSVIMGAGVIGGIFGKLKPLERSFGKLKPLGRSIAFEGVERLSLQPLGSGTIIRKAGDRGRVSLSATRSSGKLKEEIEIFGKLKKIKGETVFMPEGKGESIIKGELDYNILKGADKSFYVGGSRFDVGAKNILIGSEGDFSLILSKTGTVPRVTTGAVYSMPRTELQALKVKEGILKQLKKNVQFGGRTTVSFDPVFVSKLKGTKYGENVYLGLTPRAKGMPDISLTKIIEGGVSPGKVKGIQKVPGLTFEFGGGVPKTSFATTWSKQIVKTKLKDKKTLPKIDTLFMSPVTTYAQPKTILGGFNLPSMVGGLGLVSLPKPTYVKGVQMGTRKLVPFEPTQQKFLFLKGGEPDFLISPKVTTQFTPLGVVPSFKRGGKTLPIPKLVSFSKQYPLLKEREIYKLKNLQKQSLLQKQGFAQPIFRPSFSYPLRGGRIGRGFFFPPVFFPGLDYFETKGIPKKAKKKHFYQPGLASIALGITAPKIPEGVITGIVTRPIIKKKKKKKGGK